MKKNIKRNLFIGIGVIFLITGSALFLEHIFSVEKTNDAQVKSDQTPIVPRVSGYLKRVYVEDNQMVNKGDTLFTIQAEDYQVTLVQAEAAKAQAEIQLAIAKTEINSSKAIYSSSQAQVGSISSDIAVAQIKLDRAQKDFERYKDLYKKHSITSQQYEIAVAKVEEAKENLKMLQHRRKSSFNQSKAASSQAEISQKQVTGAYANLKSAEASVEKAKLNVGYTVVTAPHSGKVSEININPGQFISQGQSLFYLVNTYKKWVVANFKETQLSKIKPGQKVRIKIDAYPHLKLTGSVISFSPATGSRFSLLPPDNATGNFVKTVQRLPVKINFSPDTEPRDLEKISSGMNVVVFVQH